MTRVVRNNKTNAYIYLDPVLKEVFEYEEVQQATIFNEVVDGMTDAAIIEYVTTIYNSIPIDLEIVPVKITVKTL